jgi:hypothetical protein
MNPDKVEEMFQTLYRKIHKTISSNPKVVSSKNLLSDLVRPLSYLREWLATAALLGGKERLLRTGNLSLLSTVIHHIKLNNDEIGVSLCSSGIRHS